MQILSVVVYQTDPIPAMAGAKQEVVQVHTEFYKRFVFAKTEIFMKTLRMYDEQVQPFVYIFSLSDVTM